MRDWMLMLMCVCANGWQALGAELPPTDNLHVYLVIGDGHMAGSADVSAAEAAVLARCYLLNEKDEWEPAHAPLNRHSSIRQAGRTQKLGPAFYFAKAMLEQDPTISIGLVVNAGADARIELWGQKTKPYWGARGRVKKALRTGTVKGVLWRGAGNQTNVPLALDHLKDLIARLRHDLRQLDLPFVVGELHHSRAYNNQLKALTADVHATGIAGAEGLPVAEGKPLDAPSMQLLGKRYAAAMLKVQAEFNPASPVPEPTMAVIDTHIHAMDVKPAGLDALAKWMRSNNVDRCIVHPLRGSRAKDADERSQMLENYGKYEGKISRFCLVEPGEVASVEEAVALLEKEKGEGAIGLGEHYGREMMFDDPQNLRLYAACEKVGLPIMFHIDKNKNMDERGLPRVERVLRLFPNCVLIAHASWWSHLADGTCDRLLRQYPNLYADVSPGATLALNRDRTYSRAFLIRNADKILFGTDAGWWSFGKPKEFRELEFRLFEKLDLPDEVKRKIYRTNAERLFGFQAH